MKKFNLQKILSAMDRKPLNKEVQRIQINRNKLALDDVLRATKRP